MNMKIFCVAVGLMTASSWAQVPIFKLWVTEVYEVNPDGSYTQKCGSAQCPTQDLQPGIAEPGDLINIEVTVEGWDGSTDDGICDSGGEACSVSAQDCRVSHCTGFQSHGVCTVDSNCSPPDTCDLDTCEKSPLVAAFQFVMDSSTYSNGGAPGLAPAQLACTTDADCACAYTEVPGPFNDCPDFADVNPAFCTCTGPQAACTDGVCGSGAAVYIDSSAVPGYLFFGNNSVDSIGTATLNYEVGSFLVDASPGGVPEELFRCNGGNRPICNVDADCPQGTCELVAAPPYYLGTILLEATGDSCGMFTIDLIQDLLLGKPISTFLNDNNAAKLPIPIVETLTIDLGTEVPCNDGDLCTENDVFCGNNPANCAGTPIECPPGESCVLGSCQAPPGGCEFADVTDATWADADPVPSLAFDRPGNCAIDARQPHAISDANAKSGWDRLILEFSCDPSELTGLRPVSFSVTTTPVEASPPTIPAGGFDVNVIDQTVTIHLSRSISPGFYTCITHNASGSQWCAGYLPADAGQDGLSAASDISNLINSINAAPGLVVPTYAADINRSGGTPNGQDILRLIDLLNGADAFDPWIAQGLPACPSAP